MFRSLFVFCITLSIGSQLSGQIVNTERLRKYIGDKNLAINTGLNFSYDDNNGQYVYRLNARSAILYKFRDKDSLLNNKILLNGDYQLIRSENQDFKNNWFVHLRFNKEFTNVFRMEAFLQSQENRLLSISSRNLIGGGVRLKLVEAIKDSTTEKSLHLYLGMSYMYEIEKSERFDVDFNNHRISSYLTVAFDFGKGKPKFDNTLYVQPLFKDFDNYRMSEEFSANFPFSESEHVTFNLLFNYFRNNRTPIGESEYQSTISFGLSYNFK